MLLEYTDALLALLPVPTGWKKDDSASMPPRPQPNTLYLYPIRFAPQRLSEDDGQWSEAHLTVRIALAAASKGEQRTIKQERDVSVVLDDAVEAIAALFEIGGAARRTSLWWNAYYGAIAYDAVRAFDVRQAFVDVTLRIVRSE